MPYKWLGVILVLVLVLINVTTVEGQGENTVYAVLFYSPTCPHCHKVITEDLPPLQEQYGDQLKVIMINVHEPDGPELVFAACNALAVPENICGSVPMMVVGDVVMIGSQDIPVQLPNLIREGLKNGGIGLPLIPGLREAYAAFDPSTTKEAGSPSDSTSSPLSTTVTEATWQERFNEDKTGNTIAVIILVILVLSLVVLLTSAFQSLSHPHALDWINGQASWLVMLGLAVLTILTAASLIIKQEELSFPAVIATLVMLIMTVVTGTLASSQADNHHHYVLPKVAFPLVAIAGLLVAGYLTYIEMGDNEAVCGAVGDCNQVQESRYADLFGIPIGVLGVVGYIGLLIAWLVTYELTGNAARWGHIAILVLSLFGAVFSIYLTFLEPFVIGASCAWCLTSALTMHLLLWLGFSQGWLTLRNWFEKPPINRRQTLKRA
jgi:uncharacterized membrane protein